MDERIVYWKVVADWSKFRQEAEKGRKASENARREVDKTNASLEDLNKAQEDAAKSTRDLGDETRRTTTEAAKAREESARQVKARHDETAATKNVEASVTRLGSARAEQERRARATTTAEHELAKTMANDKATIEQIEAATKKLSAARDQQARAAENAEKAAISHQRALAREEAVKARNSLADEKAADAAIKAEARKAEAAAASAERQRKEYDKLDATRRKSFASFVADLEKEAKAQERLHASRQKSFAGFLSQLNREQKARENAARSEQAAIDRQANTNARILAQYERLAAAKKAADDARQIQAPTYGDNARLATAKQAVSTTPELDQTRKQILSAGQLTRAENSLAVARDNEVSSYNRLNNAEQKLAITRSNSLSLSSALRSAEADLSDAVSQHGEGSLQALRADEKRLSLSTALVDAQNKEVAAEKAATSARNGVREATDRVQAAEGRLHGAIQRVEQDFGAISGRSRLFTRTLGGLRGGLDGVKKGANDMKRAFGALRGLKLPAIAGAVYTLLEGISSLVAGLFSLASAIGPAIGGLAAIGPVAFAAAAALGAVRAAFSGIGGVLKAYQQSQLKAAEGGSKAAKSAVDNADAIASAQENLKNAREQVGVTARDVADNISAAAHDVVTSQQDELQAQKDLNQARKDAIQNVRDLKSAVVDAALAERGATLDLADARSNLQHVLDDPTATREDRQRAQLQVEQAQRSSNQARDTHVAARRAASNAAAKGVNGDSGVVQARKALADANYQLAQSEKSYRKAVTDGARENAKAQQEVTRALRELAKAQRGAADSGGAAGGAADAYNAKLAALPKSAQAFVKQLISMKHYWTELRNTAADNLFPGLTAALKETPKLFPTFNKGIGGVSRSLGNLAKKFADDLTSKTWISNFGKLFAAASGGKGIIARLGDIFMHLFNAMGAVSVAAIPLTKKLLKGTDAWAAHIDKVTKGPEAYQKMVKFFDRTYTVLHKLGIILGNLIGTFHNLGVASTTSGNDILDSIVRITGQWKTFTGSVEGKNELKTYFHDARENMKIVDTFLGKLSLGFLKMGANKNFKNITDGIRKIGTALGTAFKGNSGLSETIGHILDSVARFITAITSHASILGTFLKVFDRLLSGLATIISFKPVGAILTGVAVALGAFAALRFAAAISGISLLTRAIIGFVRGARGVEGAGNAVRAGLGGAAAGARGARGTGGRIARLTGRSRVTPTVVDPTGPIIAGTGLRLAGAGAVSPLRISPTPIQRSGGGAFVGTGAVPLNPTQNGGFLGRLRNRGDAGSMRAGAGARFGGALTGAFLSPIAGDLVRGDSRQGSVRNNLGNAVQYGGIGASLGFLAGGPLGAAAGGAIGAGYGYGKNTSFGKATAGVVGTLTGKDTIDVAKPSKADAAAFKHIFADVEKFGQGNVKLVNLAEKSIPELSKALEVGGAQGKAYAEQLLNVSLAGSDLQKNAEKAGLTQKDLTNAIGGSSAMYNRVLAVLKKTDPQFAKDKATLDALRGSYKRASDTAKAYADAHGYALASEVKVGTGADLLKGKLGTLLTTSSSVKSTTLAMNDAFGKLTSSVKQNGTSLDGNTSFGQKNIGVIRQAAAAVLAHAQAVYKQTGDLGKANEALKSGRQHLLDQASAAGFSRGKVKALSDQLYGIPKNLNSKVSVDIAGSKRTMSTLNDISRQVQILRDTSIHIPVSIDHPSAGVKIITDDGHGHRSTVTAMATGGQVPKNINDMVPGYTPGRDPHEFVSSTGYKIKLSGGEGILTPEATRAIGGAKGVAAMNKAYTSRHIPGAPGGGTESHHSGGVVGYLNKGSRPNAGLAALVAQVGAAFPGGNTGWWPSLTAAFKKRLAGVTRGTDITNYGAAPHVQNPLYADSATTKKILSWVDKIDPKSYGELWTKQPVQNKGEPNKYGRNPLLPILSYVGSPNTWRDYRKDRDSAKWASVVKNDKKNDAAKVATAKRVLADKKSTAAQKKNANQNLKEVADAQKLTLGKRHPAVLAALQKQDSQWAKDLTVIRGAVTTEKSRVQSLRGYLGLKGSSKNSGLYSPDMENPTDHAAAHALGINHPADWDHPWAGPVTAAEKALAQQDRSNALYTEWYKDLNTLAGWGFPELVNYLIDKGEPDGLSIARSAVKDKATAKQLNDSIKAGLLTGPGGSADQDTILKIVSKIASGTAAKPFGLRDVASTLNMQDYQIVNFADRLVEPLKKLPDALTKKFNTDVNKFEQGIFYANSGGMVPGPMHENRDTVDAKLTPREGVLNRRAMSLIGGEPVLNQLNAGMKPQKFMFGGMVQPSLGNLSSTAASSRGLVNAVAPTGGAGGAAGTINLNTTIVNPASETAVYSMTKELQRQSILGTVAKAAGQ